jgi:hypothetical protein
MELLADKCWCWLWVITDVTAGASSVGMCCLHLLFESFCSAGVHTIGLSLLFLSSSHTFIPLSTPFLLSPLSAFQKQTRLKGAAPHASLLPMHYTFREKIFTRPSGPALTFSMTVTYDEGFIFPSTDMCFSFNL